MSDSLRGQFLIAGKALRDANFYKSVVLLLEHGPEGALGLVVNRPTSVKVSKALGGQVELPEAVDRLYMGGPVQTTALFIVHNDPAIAGEAHEVLPGLFVGTSPETLEEIVRAASDEDSAVKFRLLSGCAGWGPEQLESELNRADWHLHPATAELVFEPNPHELWEQLISRAYKESKILPRLHGDPALN